jgi:hypothetical protein
VVLERAELALSHTVHTSAFSVRGQCKVFCWQLLAIKREMGALLCCCGGGGPAPNTPKDDEARANAAQRVGRMQQRTRTREHARPMLEDPLTAHAAKGSLACPVSFRMGHSASCARPPCTRVHAM